MSSVAGGLTARLLGHECGAEDFSDIVREINVVGIGVIVIVSHHFARTCIGMPRCDVDTRAYIGFLNVIIKVRAGTTSEEPLVTLDFLDFFQSLIKINLIKRSKKKLDSKDFEIAICEFTRGAHIHRESSKKKYSETESVSTTKT